ncbi:hypothetical protein SVI_2420 [Shewanella violacea DSS12]|uniref:Uncharacterized protein n=1 Tax=Shewanella violacea (strain JCM 10179 / CIP 106290 / LMG 19151 / DSS12) TaxID=637905 RepID=D4ZL42_SHEVD|nr:hypothetical protein SVI_2420 [Shewanella violacea DSS12]
MILLAITFQTVNLKLWILDIKKPDFNIKVRLLSFIAYFSV